MTGCQSFHLHQSGFVYTMWVASPTFKSFCIHLRQRYFAKIDVHHCPHGAGESYLTVFSYSHRKIVAQIDLLLI